MTLTEVVKFIAPQFDEPLQVCFLVIILGMMLVTILSVKRQANPAAWELKWNRGTPDDPSDDLGIEHGSVTDLWHAVATGPEKLAEVMPGMLLVVGLLGTFLGLGMALNHASQILGQPNALSASGAASSMQDLLGMMQGLGTKFKTSTWGIMGFISLKIWSEFTRYEEKRLAWVIGKVKVELDKSKALQANASSTKEKALHAQITTVATMIVKGFASEMAILIANNEKRHDQNQVMIKDSVAEIQRGLAAVHLDTSAMTESMVRFTEGTQAIVEKMAVAAESMSGGADKVGLAAAELVTAIDSFKTKFSSVLDDVRQDLSCAINDMSRQASETLERGSSQLAGATQQISDALGALSADVKQTMGSVQDNIQQSLEIQKKAALQFNAISEGLGGFIGEMTNNINKLGDSIESGLDSVANAGEHMRSIGKKLEEALLRVDGLKEELMGIQMLVPALTNVSSLPEKQQAILSELQGVHELLQRLSKPHSDSSAMVSLPVELTS